MLNSQRGNALFLILIAVVLFAALSYAITQSDRGGASAQDEMADIAISQWLQYAAGVESAVTRVMLNGCSDTDISFETSSWPTGSVGNAAYQHSPAASTKCQIFHPNGGGISPMVVAPQGLMAHVVGVAVGSPTDISSRQIFYSGIANIDGIGTESPDLIMSTGADIGKLISDATCKRYNERVRGQGEIIQAWGSGMTQPFNGVYGVGGETLASTGPTPITSFPTLCIFAEDGANQLYHVILAR